MLTLPIKQKWFDMIASGEKKEEYRDMTDYYYSRLSRYMGMVGASMNDMEPVTRQICFRAGYRQDSDFMKCEVHCDVGEGKPEWGAEPHKSYYVLKILAIKEVTRC